MTVIEAMEMTLDELRARILPNVEFDKVVDNMQKAGWTDERIVRLLLGGSDTPDRGDGSGKRPGTSERIVELLAARDGSEIRSKAGECVQAIADVLGLSKHTVRQSLEDLDRRGLVERDVSKHTGTTRVALKGATP